MNDRGAARGRLLITGAGGFTGYYVQQLALRAGFQCIALLPPSLHATAEPLLDTAARPALDAPGRSGVEAGDRAPEGVLPGVQVVRVDLNDSQRLQRVLRDIKPDFVIHLAAVAFVGHGDVAEIYHTNVIGTINLMDALADSCPALGRLIIASSGNIYGNADRLPITEDQPARPLNDYAVSKYAMECAVALRRSKLPIVVVRPFNYSGVGQSENFLLAKIVAAYRRRQSHLKLGNLHVARDFSDVRDVAGVYLRLLDAEGVGEVFNICSGRSVALLEIIETMNRLAGYSMTIEVDEALVRPNEIVELYGSDVRLRSLLGSWRQHDLDDTLQWMLTAAPPES